MNEWQRSTTLNENELILVEKQDTVREKVSGKIHFESKNAPKHIKWVTRKGL